MSTKNSLTLLLPFWAMLFFVIPASSQPEIAYQPKIASGLTGGPIDIVNAGDGTNRLFIVQRNGTIRVYNQSLNYIQDFLTVTGIGTAGEGGLLSLAFHPDYESNGFLFVYYTMPNLSLEVARYQVSAGNPHSVNPDSRQLVINIPHPVNSNHNGGKIMFGPDGYLYLATGDGGGGGDVPNNAQNGTNLLGKMLRINVTTTATAPFYTIPADNPYVADPAIADEIWALGLRNPFKWSFDRATGDLWIADVGQSALEEINYRPANATRGINYGWRCYEGSAPHNTAGCLPQSSYVAPVFTYGRSSATGGWSVTGGFVYRGTEYPSLQGMYIFADYGSDNQWTIRSNGAGGWNVQQLDDQGFPADIVAFGEAEDGTLYAASLSANTVYKVIDEAALPVNFGNIAATHKNGLLYISWVTETETNNSHFDIEASGDGKNFVRIASVATKAEGGNSDSSIHYEITLNKDAWAAVMGASLAALLLVLGGGCRKKWRLAACVTGLLLFGIVSCNKAGKEYGGEGERLFIRIAQVDQDGSKDYSKTLLVVSE